MKPFESYAKWLFGGLALLYPLLVFFSMVIFEFPVQYHAIAIIIFGLLYLMVQMKHAHIKRNPAAFISPIILLLIGAVCLYPFKKEQTVVNIMQLYPILTDAAYIVIMGSSLFIPPPLVGYFIDIIDKKVRPSMSPERFYRYCFNATIVWCVFFVIDAAIAVVTMFFMSLKTWAIYNTGITYGIMFIIFIAEVIVIKYKCRRHAAVPPVP